MNSEDHPSRNSAGLSPRQKRSVFVVLALLALAIASFLVVKALGNYTSYFYTSTQIVSGEAPLNKTIRIGGMVKEHSLQREPGALELAFVVTDMSNDVTVRYTGILPDLFKERGGTVARGMLNNQGEFIAEEIMAKHDESYLPPEVAEIMQHQKSNNEKSP